MNNNRDDLPSMPSEPTMAFGHRPAPQDEAVARLRANYGTRWADGGASTPCEPFGTPCKPPVRVQAPPRTQPHTPARPEVSPHQEGAPARPEVSPHQAPDLAALKSDVLRRESSLARILKDIPYDYRADNILAKFISTAETELSAAEEAIQVDNFVVAAQCLDRAAAALDEFKSSIKDYPIHNPWGTLGLSLLFVFLPPVLLGMFLYAVTKGESSSQEAWLYVLGFSLYTILSLGFWRIIVKERIMTFCAMGLLWRIGACVLFCLSSPLFGVIFQV